MPELVEGKHPGEHIVHEESKDLSRKKVKLMSGDLVAGTVIAETSTEDEFVQLAPTAGDSTAQAAGILWENTDASAGAVEAIAHVRLTKVRDENLTWPSGITAPQKTAALAQLKALNIIVQL